MRLTLAASAAALLAALPAAAEEIERSPAEISTIEIHGVSLDTPVEEAFNHFKALGYDSGDIETFDDWEGSGINFARGVHTDPEGESWITLLRAHGHIVSISETWNRPRDPFDTRAEMSRVQDHFGIAADDPKCRVNPSNTGACRVADAQENANFVYGMLAFPVSIQQYATRNHELKDTW